MLSAILSFLTNLTCLADTIYYEARGEIWEGQIAVAQVVLLRAELSQSEICVVVKEKRQFAPALQKPSATYRANRSREYIVALLVLMNYIIPRRSRNYVNSYFETVGHDYLERKYGLRPTERIGNHQFFREARRGYRFYINRGNSAEDTNQ